MKRRIRYLLILAVSVAGLGLTAGSQPAAAYCAENPFPKGPPCVPCPDLSKFGIYCFD